MPKIGCFYKFVVSKLVAFKLVNYIDLVVF